AHNSGPGRDRIDSSIQASSPVVDVLIRNPHGPRNTFALSAEEWQLNTPAEPARGRSCASARSRFPLPSALPRPGGVQQGSSAFPPRPARGRVLSEGVGQPLGICRLLIPSWTRFARIARQLDASRFPEQGIFGPARAFPEAGRLPLPA